ncbi:acetyl-CoA C-acetyltransferase, partial [Paracoccus marcusii]
MTIQDIYVLGAARTPMGGLMGALSGVSAADLGGAAIAAALARAGGPAVDAL